MNMKTILIVISKDIIRRNILDTDFWPNFISQNKENKIILLVEGDKVAYFQKHFACNNVQVKGYDRVSSRGYNKFVIFLVRTGIKSHSTKLYRMRAYKRGQASLSITFLKELISLTLARMNWYKHFVRYLVFNMNISTSLKEIYDEIKPDLVFVPSLIDNDFDVPVAIEAKKRGIRLVGMVRSWDNLNNHGLLAVIPDRLIVQNVWLKECAEKFQAIKKDFIKDIIGLPHYDRYKNPANLIMPKEEFFLQLGLNINKKLIFLAGFDFYYSEDKLPAVIDDAIEKEDIEGDVQILFTQHPASLFTKKDYNIDKLKHITYLNLFSGKEMGFQDTEQTFINLAYHADVIVNVASTVSIDAAVFNRPVVCVGFDNPQNKLSYWESASRLFDYFDHYECLVSTGGVKVATTPQNLVFYINEYLKNSNLDKSGRVKILKNFVEPFDGSAAKRLAGILTQETSIV